MNEYAFEALNISRSFGVIQALEDVSMAIRPGEIHAIIGENGAGKSTLMNIFCGKLPASEGELRRNGQKVMFHSPIDAQNAGVAIAPQEINLVPNLSVEENIMLGAHVTRRIGIDWCATRKKAIGHLHTIDDTIDPRALVHSLPKVQQQLVQIARAAATNAEILIFDEPTAALTYRETENLYAYLKAFRAAGGSVFYISHRLNEILALSDRISVLRDGHSVGELMPAETSKDEMVRMMAGRQVSAGNKAGCRSLEDRQSVLKVEGLSRQGEFSNVSFSLRQGEILGVTGLVGSGRTELAKCIFGLTRMDGGFLELFGEETVVASPADAIRRGLVYLPEERKQEGIFPLLNIAENMALPNLDRFQNLLWMRTGDMYAEVQRFVADLKIKIGNPKDRITSLSGGNQQKVVIGRWLMKDARILIMDEPTRGIDVAAKFEIQRQLRMLTEKAGLSIIFISSELEEVLDVADRIMVMHEGEVKGIFAAAEATQETLLQAAMS